MSLLLSAQGDAWELLTKLLEPCQFSRGDGNVVVGLFGVLCPLRETLH